MNTYIFRFSNNHTLLAQCDLNVLLGYNGKFLEVIAIRQKGRKFFVNLENVVCICEYDATQDEPISNQD